MNTPVNGNGELPRSREFKSPFLITTPARHEDRLRGLVIALISTAFFVLLVPYASAPLTPIPGFIGVYQSALIVIQLLVTLLFFAKFYVLRLPALLYLASAYLFSALMAIAHALTFPGLFRPSGFLQATPQTTAWLYMFWHAGFPLLLIAYGLTKRLKPSPSETVSRAYRPILLAIAGVLLCVLFLTLLSTFGANLLPPIMVGNQQYFPTMKPVVTTVCALSLVALVVLWRAKPYNVMDIWLMVVCTSWVFDIALSAVLNTARFDTGFYFGRLYGLIAAGVILGVLLFESTKMYGQLVQAHARDIEVNDELNHLYLKAQELDKLKTRFFANMSHEIRTPMNAILGITYLLKRSNPTPEQVERLDKIALASRHLLTIINDILDFSKIESGAMLLEENTFPISAVLDHTRSLIEDAAHAKGLVISVDYDDCPHWLIGDQTRLRQAMLNFASNAVKFTDHGRIELKCSLVEQTHELVLIRFEVADTGIGIAAEVIPELFHAFKQVDASTTRKYGGTGLGLAITQKLALLMGGTVGVDSTVGQGSRFWFTAKLKVGTQVINHDTGNAEQELQENHAGTRVLLVEDDPINQEIARVLLSEAGLQVALANNGQEALDLARLHVFDLILMDIQMPVMDGIEATKQIRLLPDRQDVPILALTANIFDEDRRHCREAGMSDLIGKPVDPLELFATILKWLPKANNVRLSVLQTPQPAASSSKNALLMSRLPNVVGLDLDLGLSRVRGDVNKFWPLIKEFVTYHEDDMPQLRKALQRQQINEAMRLAHTLKGTAGTLGLTQLQDDAQRLESSLQAGITDLESLIQQIAMKQLALAQVVNSIASEQVEPEAAPNPQQAQELLTQMEVALKTGDFHANQMFTENLPLLRASLPRVIFCELETAVDNYDFEKAVQVIGRIRADFDKENAST